MKIRTQGAVMSPSGGGEIEATLCCRVVGGGKNKKKNWIMYMIYPPPAPKRFKQSFSSPPPEGDINSRTKAVQSFIQLFIQAEVDMNSTCEK